MAIRLWGAIHGSACTLKFSTGVRWYRYQSQATEQEYGIEYPTQLTPAVVVPGVTKAADKGLNPRFNLSYSPNKDLTTYLSASKGFRPGGANEQVPASLCGAAPSSFGPDTIWDYEVGEKAKLFDNRLTINSDFYYIKWNGVQQAPLLLCGYQYDTNAGDGRSFGPELEINAKLSDQWSLSASAAGCTAPILNVPKETAAVALTYATTVLQNFKLTARIADSYVGSSIDESYYFDIPLPSYSIANARVGLSGDKWSASLFVDNLANKVAQMTANNTSFQFNIPYVVRYSTNQPRTFGTQVNYRF